MRRLFRNYAIQAFLFVRVRLLRMWTPIWHTPKPDCFGHRGLGHTTPFVGPTCTCRPPSSGFHALIGSLIHSKTFLKHHVRMSRLLDEGVGIRTPPSSSPALSAEHLSPYIQKELILALLGNSARTLIWRSLRGPSLIQASYKTVECTHSWLIRYNEEVITREDLQQGV